MNMEKIFRRISGFETIEMDVVLFEANYPVLFTCKNHEKLFLFSCCLANAQVIKWVGAETNYETLISLLENRITIRDAFLRVSEQLLVIEYDGKDVRCELTDRKHILPELLPTAGEFMDAEENEFSEEITTFKERSKNVEYSVRIIFKNFVVLTNRRFRVELSDEWINEETTMDGIQDSIVIPSKRYVRCV